MEEIKKLTSKDFSQIIKISDGFSMVKTDFNFKKPYKISSSQNERKMVMTITLDGKAIFKNCDGKSANFEKGYTTITSFDNTDGFTQCESPNLNQIRFILEESFLKRNFSEISLEKYGYYNQNRLNLISFSPLRVESLMDIKQMLIYKKCNDLDKLYMQGKSLELLSRELNKSKQKITLDSYERKALMKAREILLKDIKTSHDIPTLAKKVHLNEVKFKMGFKELFGQTPYNFLKSYRLKEAKNLLISGEYNINETAQIIGYKYANNFSSAFVKEFGINPKEVLKSVKYY